MSRFVLSAELQIRPPSQASIKRVVNQVNAQLRGIQAPNIFNSSQIKSQSQKASRAINNTSKAASGLNQQLGKLRQRFSQRIIDASVFSVVNTVIAGVGQAFSAAVRSAIAFEIEMAKIAQVTGGAISSLRGLEDSITATSTAFGVSSSELVTVARTFSQAGLSISEVQRATDAIAKSDLAPTFESMQKTAEGVIAIFGQFGTAASEVEGQLGSLNALAAKFAVESGDLIEAVKRGGSAFRTSGGDLEEFGALVTTVRSTTREGAAQIGTGLRTIFTRIQRPQTIKYFKELGVELTDATGKFIGGFEAVRRLSAAFGDLEQGDTKLIDVAQQLGGVRQVTRVLPLLQNFERAQQALNVAKNGTNSIDKEQEKRLNTLAKRFDILKQNTLALGRAIMKQLGPALKIVADGLSSFIGFTTNIVNAFGNLNILFGEGATVALTLGTAVGALAFAFGGLTAQASVFLGLATALAPILIGFAGQTGDSTKATREFNQSIVELVGTLGALLAIGTKLGGFSGISLDALKQGDIGGSGIFKSGKGKARLGSTVVGGAAGAGASVLVAKAYGRSTKALLEFEEAVKKAKDGASETDVFDAATKLQTEKDLDNFNMAISGSAGALAGAFLGPAGGALVGTLTAFIMEGLSSVQMFRDLIAGGRDFLSWLTVGYVRGNDSIAATATANALAKASIEKTVKAVKEFEKSLAEATEDGKELTIDKQAEMTNKALEENLEGYEEAEKRRKRILDQDGDGINERVSGDTGPLALSKDEEQALADTNKDLADKRGFVESSFEKLAERAILSGEDFETAFARLSPAVQEFVKKTMGISTLERKFAEDGEFRKNLIARKEDEYVGLLADKIRLERKLAEQTISLLKVQDEAAQIIAEFGGAKYGAREQEANLLQQFNAGSNAPSRNLSAGSIRERAEESGAELAEVRKRLTLLNTEGEKGNEQKRLEAREKQLSRLNKQTYDITKKLIDIRKKELEIISARNAEEKQGLEDALKGDFSKLFDAQAAQGVIASVASGGGVGGFSQTAIADAIANLRTQQEAGAGEVFGQNITSLIERVAAGGLANVGLGGDAAQVLAGTTPEEEQLKKEIRELAGVLPAAAQSEMQAAQMQLEAARQQAQAAGAQLIRAGQTVGQDQQTRAEDSINKASGGTIWRKRGTDSVPAMLTPGEFVVRRSAVQRGNNLNMLRAMNQGGSPKSVGGTVYASGGGLNTASGDGFDFSMLNKAAEAMSKVSNAMTQMVEKLGQLKLNVTLAPTSHTVNLTGTSALQNMGDQIQERVLEMVGEKLKNSQVGSGGQVEENMSGSNLPSAYI